MNYTLKCNISQVNSVIYPNNCLTVNITEIETEPAIYTFCAVHSAVSKA